MRGGDQGREKPGENILRSVQLLDGKANEIRGFRLIRGAFELETVLTPAERALFTNGCNVNSATDVGRRMYLE